MPKATLTFNLPEENGEYEVHINGPKYHTVLFEFANKLREKTKYAEPNDPETPGWEAARTAFWEICNDEGIDPYQG